MDFANIIGGIFSGLPGAVMNAQNVRETNQSNRNLVAQQNYSNLQQWKRETDYNNPINQVQRLKSAGLNPNLLYGTPPQNVAATSPTMQSSHDVPYNFGDLNLLNSALQVAQIENIQADTEQKKGLTIEKQLDNEIHKMNNQAFKSAYEEGLVHSAAKAGLGKVIDDYRGSRYTLFESAWNFAILTGVSLSDSLAASDKGNLSGQVGLDGYNVDFQFTKSAFDRAKSLYIGGTEAQISANEAARMVADAQKEQKKKDVDIWEWLNDNAKSDKWYKSVPATIGLIGLFIAEQRFSLPSFNFSISSGKKGLEKTFNLSN